LLALTIGLFETTSTPKSTSAPSNTVHLSLASETNYESGAVGWAERQVGTSEYQGVPWADLCLTFVYDAYAKGAGVDLEARTKGIMYNSQTDPQMVWGAGGSHFTTGIWKATSDSNSVPYGALVFFNATPPHGPEDFSHIAIMDSRGELIMTPGSPGQSVFRQTFAQRAAARPWNTMVGWWLPDGTKTPPTATAKPPTQKPTNPSTSSGGSPVGSSILHPTTGGGSLQPTTGGGSLQPTTGGGSLQPTTGGGSLQPTTGGGGSVSPPSSGSSSPPSSSGSNPPITQPTTGTSGTQPVVTPPPPTTYTETVGGVSHTWTNYSNAGGSEGPSIPSYETVQIACKVTGFKVADGNTWWYRIASSPWNNQYYVSADAFYNNGETSGSLHGTPLVDSAVPNC
jgi:hypothetical protein